MKPNDVNILGVDYKILYVDKPSDVDIHKRESLWGQIDFWTRVIKIYDKDRSDEDVWQTIIHEVLHGIAEGMHIKVLEDDDNHTDLDRIAVALTDVLFRNDWIRR